MRIFALFVLTDIFITVRPWSCVSPIRKVYSRVNSSAVLQFSADLSNLPIQFEVKFYDDSTRARISYDTDKSFRTQSISGVSITGDTAGNVVVTLDNVKQNNAGIYIMDIAGVPAKCNCLYILGNPSKPKITLSQTPFVGENTILTCHSESNTIPRNHSLNLLYNWVIDLENDPNDPRYSYTSKKETLIITHIVKDDTNKQVSCSAIENSNFNYSSPMSDALSFDVYYGPDVVKINVESPYYLTEGETNRQIRCSSVCYPNCTFLWTHVKDDVSVGTGGLLSFNPVNRSAAGGYKCIARNTAAKDSTETYKYVNVQVIVQYPPTVTIRSSAEVIREGQELTLYCEGDGVPAKNKYISFTQTVNNVVVPNNNLALPGTERFSTIQFLPLLFQDTGTYRCTLNNGIKNTREELDQSGSKEVIVEAPPQILTDELRFTGSSQGVGQIKVSIYSYPALDHVMLLRQDGKAISSDTFNVSNSIVQTSFYGKEVLLNGDVFDFKIRDLKEDDFGNYTLKLTNKLDTTTNIVSLIAEGRPSSPNLFQYLAGKNTPSFVWKKNFNGGLVQRFIIQVSVNGTNIWTNVTNVLESDEKYQINGSYFLTEVRGLKPGLYTARIVSKNSKGESDIVVLGRTFQVLRQTENGKPIAAIVGGSVCAVVVLLIGVVVLILFLRRAKNKGGKKTKYFQNAEHDNEEEESEVNTVNPMYAPADEIIQDNTYSQPLKKKKAAPEESNLYSVVTKKKEHGKEGKKNLHEESLAIHEQVTSTSQKLVNKDGLIYADLTFNDMKTEQNKMTYRNIDSKTEYVEVDFSKKAEPLPDSDDEKHAK